jgi:hypothetical protein
MLIWSNIATVSNAIWAILESFIIIGAPIFWISRMFRKMDKRLDKIEYQLYENGGSSMKDQMNRQDKALHELQINQAIIMTKMKQVEL